MRRSLAGAPGLNSPFTTMPEGPPRIYKGTFCTGHVPMVGTTSIQFSENSFHEYIEEYKNAHGMKVKTGPGLAHVPCFDAP